MHVLDWADPVLALPRLPRSVSKAYRLADKSPVAVTPVADGLALRLGAERDPVDTIVVLELGAR